MLSDCLSAYPKDRPDYNFRKQHYLPFSLYLRNQEHKSDNKKENNGERSLIKKAALFNKKWYLLQVNSDVMFREELGKIQNTWLLVFVICLLCALGLSLSFPQILPDLCYQAFLPEY